jgi:hypothetical protein
MVACPCSEAAQAARIAVCEMCGMEIMLAKIEYAFHGRAQEK